MGPTHTDALADELLGWRGVVAIEAPSGYGKSALLDALATKWAGPVHRTIPRSGVLPPDPRSLLLIDDAADESVIGADTGLVVVAARVLPRTLVAQVRAGAGGRLVTANQLALDEQTLASMLGGAMDDKAANQVASVIAMNGGRWPALGQRMVAAASSSADPVGEIIRVADTSALVPDLLERCAPLSAEDRWALAQLAHFPRVTERCFEAIGPGSDFLRRLRAAGYPLEPGSDGVVAFNPALRRWLRGLAPLDDAAMQTVSAALAFSGDKLSAAWALISADQMHDAAEVLGQLSITELQWMPSHAAAAALEAVDEAVGPRALIARQRGRIYAWLGRPNDAQDKFELAYERAQVEALDERTRCEIRAELLEELAYSDRSILTEINELQRQVPRSWALARKCLALARMTLLTTDVPDLRSLAEAEHEVLTSVAAVEMSGDALSAAHALRQVAATLMLEQCRYHEVDSIVKRCTELAGGHPYHHVNTLLLACYLKALEGDLEGFKGYEEQVSALIGPGDMPIMQAQRAWGEMIANSWRRDAATTLAFKTRAERLMGQVSAGGSGSGFYATAAESLARVGDVAGALDALAVARSRRDENEGIVRFAELVVEARVGTPDTAFAIGEEIRNVPSSHPCKRWRAAVEMAVAAARAGVDDEARHWLSTARIEAMSCGETVRTHHLDPALERIDKHTEIDLRGVAISVFGPFRVTVNGQPISVPKGTVSQVLKVLACRGGAVPTETLLDLLWPDASEAEGRRRFKNVSLRVRTALGGDWIERGENSIRFRPDVRIDLAEFDQAAQRTRLYATTHDDRAPQSALDALAMVDGPLLADDLYEDWAADARAVTTAKVYSLLDVALAAPPSVRVAPPLFDVVCRVDPEALEQLEMIAARAKEEGSSLTARAAIQQVQRVSESLGF